MRDGVPLHGSLAGLHDDPDGNLEVVGASMILIDSPESRSESGYH